MRKRLSGTFREKINNLDMAASDNSALTNIRDILWHISNGYHDI